MNPKSLDRIIISESQCAVRWISTYSVIMDYGLVRNEALFTSGHSLKDRCVKGLLLAGQELFMLQFRSKGNK